MTETTEQLEDLPAPDFTDADLRAEVEAIDVGDFARDDDERLLLRYLRRRGQVLAEITHIKEQTAAMLRQLESRLKGLDHVYLPHAEDVARRKLDGQKVRSLKTPFGTVGFRKQPARLVVVDDAACLAALDAAGAAECVRVKREVAKAELSDRFAKTGELVDGTEWQAEGEKFYVK